MGFGNLFFVRREVGWERAYTTEKRSLSTQSIAATKLYKNPRATDCRAGVSIGVVETISAQPKLYQSSRRVAPSP